MRTICLINRFAVVGVWCATPIHTDLYVRHPGVCNPKALDFDSAGDMWVLGTDPATTAASWLYKINGTTPTVTLVRTLAENNALDLVVDASDRIYILYSTKIVRYLPGAAGDYAAPPETWCLDTVISGATEASYYVDGDCTSGVVATRSPSGLTAMAINADRSALFAIDGLGRFVRRIDIAAARVTTLAHLSCQALGRLSFTCHTHLGLDPWGHVWLLGKPHSSWPGASDVQSDCSLRVSPAMSADPLMARLVWRFGLEGACANSGPSASVTYEILDGDLHTAAMYKPLAIAFPPTTTAAS